MSSFTAVSPARTEREKRKGLRLMIALAIPSMLLPLGTLLLLLLAFDCRKSPVQAALISGLCFSVALYGLRLDAANDIARHIALLANYEKVSFVDCFGAGHYDALFVWDIWCWIVAKIGDPYLLQSSAAFIGYAIITFVVCDFCKRVSASRLVLAIGLFHVVAAVPILGLVSGIRSSVALLLCALAAYLHLIRGLPWIGTIALSLLGVFIHPVSIMALVLLLLFKPITNRPVIGLVGLFFVLLASAAIGNAIMPVLSGSGNPVFRFLATALESFLSYSEGNEWTAAHSSSFNSRVNQAFTLLWIGYIVVSVIQRRDCARHADSASSLDRFVLVLAVATIALSLVLEVNGTRLVPMLFLLGEASIVARMTHRPSKENKALFVFDGIGMLIAIGLLALHCYSVAYGIVDSPTLLSTVFIGIIGIGG